MCIYLPLTLFIIGHGVSTLNKCTSFAVFAVFAVFVVADGDDDDGGVGGAA